VVLLNDLGVPVANDLCRNSNLRDCVDVNPLGLNDVGVFKRGHERTWFSNIIYNAFSEGVHLEFFASS
jgi:hypothetical protein